MPGARFYYFILCLAFVLVLLWVIIVWAISAMRKRAVGKVNVLHEFADEKAEVDVEALKKQKEEELQKYKKEKLGAKKK